MKEKVYDLSGNLVGYLINGKFVPTEEVEKILKQGVANEEDEGSLDDDES